MLTTELAVGASFLLAGDHTALASAHRLITQQALGGNPPLLIDCGGVFDPYTVAQAARRQGIEPRRVLERIAVCRAFTGYQELRALRRVAQLSSRPSLYVMEPLQLLLDADLPAMDRPWLFQRILAGLRYLAASGTALRLCQHSAAASALPEGADFLRTLERRFPLIRAQEGRLQVSGHGQVRAPVQPGHRPDGSHPRAVPTRAA